MKKRFMNFLGMWALALVMVAGLPIDVNAETLPETAEELEAPAQLEDIPMETNGWVKNADGTYYYYVDGEKIYSRIYKVNGTYYFFKSTGEMLDNGTYQYTDSFGTVNCRAKKGGALYSGEWYINGDDKYYYAEGGMAANGVTAIDGKLYNFNAKGLLLEDETTVTYNDKEYFVNNAGVLIDIPENGWIKVGKNWYYAQDGALVKSKVMKIGALSYAFDRYGMMYLDRTFTLNGKRYLARHDGSLYNSGWYTFENIENYRMYFGEDCVGYTGLKEIDGVSYVFSEDSSSLGYLKTSGTYTSDGVTYFIKPDGTLKEVKSNGWNLVDGNWYYMTDGVAATNNVLKINGKYYGFDHNGVMAQNEEFEIYSSIHGGYTTFRASKDGSLLVNQWYSEKYGNINYYDSVMTAESYEDIYYYGEDGAMVTGVTTIDGKLYYFSNSGYMYTDSGKTVEGVYYYFDETGVGKAYSEGWNKTYDNQWIYIEDGKLVKGLKEIDGKTYYFDSSGDLTSEADVYYTGGKYYLIDRYGVVIEKTGWVKHNGYYYYLDENYNARTGFVTIDGTEYYLDPEMACNSEIIIKSDDSAYQAIGASGALTPITTDGWYFDGNDKYYVEDGYVVSGWKQIGNSWYYCFPYMVVNSVLSIDNAYYYFDSTGKMLVNSWTSNGRMYATKSGKLATGDTVIDGKTYSFDSKGYLIEDEYVAAYEMTVIKDGVKNTYTLKNGWNQIDGKWYYVINGELIKDTAISIGGKLYGFDYYGAMVTNTIYDEYIFDKNGIGLIGWQQWGGDWYYLSPQTGRIATGLYTIGKYQYYFYEAYGVNYGTMCTTETIIDGEKYTFNSNGTLKSVTALEEGWNDVNGQALYVKDGNLYTGWLGSSYFVRGIKLADCLLGGEDVCYIDANGKVVKDDFINFADPYDNSKNIIYLGSEGNLLREGWILKNGSWYYADTYVTTGVATISGTSYYFDESGKLLKTFSTIPNGWQKVDGKWLYARNGSFVINDVLCIGGKWYAFENGIMVTDKILNNRYYDKNGYAKTTAGWQLVNGTYYYISADGYTHEGWLTLSGNTYYLAPEMLTGYQILDEKLYYFDKNGVCQGEKGVKNGWYKAGNDWYYMCDGYVVYNDMMIVGGNRYYFDETGKMVTNRVFYDGYRYYYFGSDGAQVKAKGIYKDALGNNIYVTADGLAHVGYVYVDGVFKQFMTKVLTYFYLY